MKEKFVEAHMKTADVYSKLSSAKRLQVGCVIVKNNTIIGIGYNGMPAGWNNDCEYREWMSNDAGGWLNPDEIKEQWPFEELSDEDLQPIGRYKLVTRPEVLHAETNAIAKLAKPVKKTEERDLTFKLKIDL